MHVSNLDAAAPRTNGATALSRMPTPPGAWLDGAANRLIAALRRRQRVQRAMAELDRLGDRGLQDIGVPRHAIRSVAEGRAVRWAQPEASAGVRRAAPATADVVRLELPTPQPTPRVSASGVAA